jgi:DNA repair exonuclease SbcCD ATPase subunit
MLEMIHGTNFRSYEDVKLEFGAQRVSVVFGDSSSDFADSNGAGKSSLMYLVLWTLFGKWPGMSNADSCVRQPVNKDCCGIVWLKKPEGRYAISRYRRHILHGNNVFIQPPNQNSAATLAPDIISGDLKMMNDRIEGLLGMNYETFVRTMVFTGSEHETFALMTDKEQKALLDTIVPLDFSGLLDRAKGKFKQAMETEIECGGVSKAIDGWLTRNEAALLEIEQQKKDLAKERDEDAILHGLADAEQAESYMQAEIEAATRAREELWPKISQAESEVTAYKPVVKAFEDARERWEMFSNSTSRLKEQEEERTRALSLLDEDIKRENHHLDQHKAGKTCHTCGQPLGPEALATAVASAKKTLDRVQTQKIDAIRRYDNLQQDYLSRQTKSGFDADTAAKYTVDYKAAHTHLHSLSDALDVLTRQDRQHDTTISTSRREQAEAKRRIEHLTSLLKPDDTRGNELKEKAKKLSEDNDRLKRDRKHSGDNQQRWADEKALWSNVVDMFGGGKGSLQHFLFESLLPEMTATAQMFLSLFSKDELRVAFKSHKAKGSKTVEGFYIEATKGAQTKGYGDLSGGERRRVDFCIFLTLHLMAAKHVFSTGVLFLDEIADFMDDTGQQSIVSSVLDFLCQQYGVSCLLLTNKRELVASVAHGYRCEMADGVSRLVSVQET